MDFYPALGSTVEVEIEQHHSGPYQDADEAIFPLPESKNERRRFFRNHSMRLRRFRSETMEMVLAKIELRIMNNSSREQVYKLFSFFFKF